MGNLTNSGNEIKSSFFGCGRCEGERNLCSSPGGYGEIKVDELPQKNIDITTKTPNLNYFNNPEMRIKPNEFVRSFSFEPPGPAPQRAPSDPCFSSRYRIVLSFLYSFPPQSKAQPKPNLHKNRIYLIMFRHFIQFISSASYRP